MSRVNKVGFLLLLTVGALSYFGVVSAESTVSREKGIDDGVLNVESWGIPGTHELLGESITKEVDNISEVLMKRQVQVVFLGTGTPNRFPQVSTAIIVNKPQIKTFIVDLGSGAMASAWKAHQQLGIAGLAPQYLTHALITHGHNDHTNDLSAFLSSPPVVGRKGTVHVYGPVEIEQYGKNTFEGMIAWDRKIRLEGFERDDTDPRNFVTDFHQIKQEEVILSEDGIRVTAFPVIHGEVEPSWGFRIDIEDEDSAEEACIVLSGDTAADAPRLMEHANQCDVLIHEVFSSQGLDGRTDPTAAFWQEYHRLHHTSGSQLGRIATQLQTKLLLYHHQLLWGASRDDLAQEVAQSFDGVFLGALDLDVVEFPDSNQMRMMRVAAADKHDVGRRIEVRSSSQDGGGCTVSNSSMPTFPFCCFLIFILWRSLVARGCHRRHT